MGTQLTHESAIVPSDALNALSDVGDHEDELAAIIESRAATKAGDTTDLIIELEDWAHEDWSDYDISSSPFILVDHVEDYSDNAYLLTGASEVVMDKIEGRGPEEVRDGRLSDQLNLVDETDTDFHDDTGEMYVPKSAVAAIYVES